jgi:hypothetical protein
MGGCGLHSYWGLVAGSCEHGNESAVSIKGGDGMGWDGMVRIS